MSYNADKGTFGCSASFQSSKAPVPGQQAPTVSPAVSPSTSFILGTTALGTCNLNEPLQYTIVPSGTLSIDLTSIITAILGTVTFARIKGYIVAQDPTSLATAGISIDQSTANSFLGWFSGATGTPIITLKVGGFIAIGGDVTDTGYVVDGTHKIIHITNLDAAAGHNAIVNVFLIGADA